MSLPGINVNEKEVTSRDVPFLTKMKKDLRIADEQCYARGLVQSAKWMSELLLCMQDIEIEEEFIPMTKQLGNEFSRYSVAKRYFDLKEYDRAAYFTENCKKDLPRFLNLYSMYLSGEKKKNDDMVDSLNNNDFHEGLYLKNLQREFSQMYKNNDGESSKDKDEKSKLDAWQLWLYGVVLKKLDLTEDAVKILCESLHQEPMHWGTWLELATLISDREMLQDLTSSDKLPDHWMRKFFLAHTYLELQLNDEALELYSQLQNLGLQSSTYIMAQVAITHHNQRDVDQAVSIFKELEEIDPYRLDNLDTYSNLLYVKELRVQLSHLAHRVEMVDKYRVETCCVIGNYYSLRSNHEKAIKYFQRALRLNPQYLAAWTLMGHEYMEVKSTNAAIQCYRQAIEVNRRDYRAWYGLGQTYELLKLHAYCLYYFKQAQKLRPNDSRMLVALGESYERLQKYEEAKKCYLKAQGVGDLEVISLYKLARLYSNLKDEERAAVIYERYLMGTEDAGSNEERAQAYQYLANYCLQRGMLTHAAEYAQKCTLCPETRETGKSMLKEIANKKQHGPADSTTEDCGRVLTSRVRPESPGNLARNLNF